MFVCYYKDGTFMSRWEFLPSGFFNVGDNVYFSTNANICIKVGDGRVDTYPNGMIRSIGSQSFVYKYYEADGFTPKCIGHIYSDYGTVSFEYNGSYGIVGVVDNGTYYEVKPII